MISAHRQASHYYFFALALFLLLASGDRAVLAEDIQALTAQAESLYKQRGDLSQAVAAAGMYRRILNQDPGNKAAALRLCQVLVWLGVNSQGEPEKSYYREAVAAGRQAVQCHPGQTGPIYWLGVACGLLADKTGALEGLGLVKEAKSCMACVIEQDPGYDYGGPYRVLGRVYTKLPPLLGRDLNQAETLLRKALSYGPKYWLNHLFLADVLARQGREEEARQLLLEIKNSKPEPGLAPEWCMWHKEACRYLGSSSGGN
ncbi:MAG: TRAP transporter TatT component family protein [Pseudomonadota bacterium]